jgi:hypothetical protein
MANKFPESRIKIISTAPTPETTKNASFYGLPHATSNQIKLC